MHYIGVMFASEQISRTSHIGCELIGLVKATVQNLLPRRWLAQVGHVLALFRLSLFPKMT